MQLHQSSAPIQIHAVWIFVIIVFAALAMWANAKLNPVRVLQVILHVVIVVVAVLFLLSSLGMIGDTGIRVGW
jgi:small-conductance mechanosensitive channel